MNHQQFEHWLLMEEPLTDDQVESLRSHLEICESCRQLSTSWSEVQRLFISAPSVGPESGFVSRWQARMENQMEKEMQDRQHRQSWMVFVLTSLGSLLLFALGVNQMTSTFGSLSQFLVFWIGHLTELLTTTNVILEAAKVIFRTISTVIPISYWLILLSGLSVLCLFWILSLQHIYNQGGLLNEVEN